MKRITIVAVTFFLILNGVKAQQTDQGLMTNIDKQRQEIKSKMSTYRRVVRFRDSLSTKYYFYQGKELQMVTIWVKAGTVDKNIEWYFAAGKMIYSENNWKDRVTGKVTENQHYYLKNEEVFVWIKTDGSRGDATSKEFLEAKEGLSKLAGKMREDATHF